MISSVTGRHPLQTGPTSLKKRGRSGLNFFSLSFSVPRINRGCLVPQLTSVRAYRCTLKLSRRRDSNPRRSAWKADALSTELLLLFKIMMEYPSRSNLNCFLSFNEASAKGDEPLFPIRIVDILDREEPLSQLTWVDSNHWISPTSSGPGQHRLKIAPGPACAITPQSIESFEPLSLRVITPKICSSSWNRTNNVSYIQICINGFCINSLRSQY